MSIRCRAHLHFFTFHYEKTLTPYTADTWARYRDNQWNRAEIPIPTSKPNQGERNEDPNLKPLAPHSHGPAGSMGELGPLWNRALTAVSTYDLYDSTTRVGSFINATMAAPTGVSKLCLSCHDGTIAIDSFGRSDTTGLPFESTPGEYVGDINANANIGGGTPGGTSSDLSNDHPVSFVYADSVAGDTEIIAAAGGLPLFGGNLECATCHDVHATESVPDTKLLRVDNAGSLLCLTCHDK